MFWSAVSLALVVASSPFAEQAKDMQAAWKIISPSVVRLKEGVTTVGSAVLIDPSGYFLAHKSTANVGLVTGVTASGDTFPLMRISNDEATGLVLLRASRWRDAGSKPIRTTVSSPRAGTPVVIVMSNGLEAGEVSNPSRSGVLPQSKRLVFLTEIKLENPTPNLGGAPVFTYQGEFVGLLNANLQSNSLRPQNQFAGMTPSFSNRLEAAPSVQSKSFAADQNYGPSTLFVAYALGPEMLQRVIGGFLGPTHQVLHPYIGLYVQDTPKGVLVHSVTASSPASMTDLQVGDRILAVSGTPIRTRLDYAHSLMHVAVGDRVMVLLDRDGHRKSVEITVGKMPN